MTTDTEVDAYDLPALDVDETDYASDSDYASGIATDTTSLSSSITHYQYENGRRYHAFREGQYAFPNDETEQDRLDMMHHIWLLRFSNKLFLAPLNKISVDRVLDIGTGTGIWAIDFADEFPAAEVVGTDISPIQPRWVPPNLKFEVDDAEADWTYKHTFDYIHGRNLGGGIMDWPKLMTQVYENLTPGGYFELAEVDTTFRCDDASWPVDDPLHEFQEQLNIAAERIGRGINASPKVKGWMEDAGFTEISEVVVKTPLGAWPKDKLEKEIGVYYREMLAQNLEGIAIALLTRVMGWPAEKVSAESKRWEKSLKNPRIHLYVYWNVVVGRKPLPKEKEKAKA